MEHHELQLDPSKLDMLFALVQCNEDGQVCYQELIELVSSSGTRFLVLQLTARQLRCVSDKVSELMEVKMDSSVQVIVLLMEDQAFQLQASKSRHLTSAAVQPSNLTLMIHSVSAAVVRLYRNLLSHTCRCICRLCGFLPKTTQNQPFGTGPIFWRPAKRGAAE